MCFSKLARLPRPRCCASSGVTMKPAPCKATPREQRPSLARSGTTEPTSVPTVKSGLIRPARSTSSTTGSSVSSPLSRTTSRSTPSCSPFAATVIAIRTAAESAAAFVHGWSGIAITNDTGVFASMRFFITRRENSCVIELVVTKPKRRRGEPFAVRSSAARSHQYMTKSALSFMCLCAAQRDCA